MVATDSYRLSASRRRRWRLRCRASSRRTSRPARCRSWRASPSRTSSESLAVSVGQNQVVFELGDVVLSSRLIDGQFPNYRQLLPESVEHELRLSSAELTDVVRRISLLAQKNAPLRLGFSEGELTVSAQTPDVGEASETIPVPFHGEPFEIGFNPEFLRDGLESVESDELVLKLISPLRPGLIESPDGGDFVYLIMPIRLNALSWGRGRCAWSACSCATSAPTPAPRLASATGLTVVHGPTAPASRTCSRRSTSAVPGARREPATSASWCASARRPRASSCNSRDGAHEHELSVGFEPGRSPSA